MSKSRLKCLSLKRHCPTERTKSYQLNFHVISPLPPNIKLIGYKDSKEQNRSSILEKSAGLQGWKWFINFDFATGVKKFVFLVHISLRSSLLAIFLPISR